MLHDPRLLLAAEDDRLLSCGTRRQRRQSEGGWHDSGGEGDNVSGRIWEYCRREIPDRGRMPVVLVAGKETLGGSVGDVAVDQVAEGDPGG